MQAFVIIRLPSFASLQALLAQLAEQLTLNQRVVGSSPTGGTSASVRPIMASRSTPPFPRVFMIHRRFKSLNPS